MTALAMCGAGASEADELLAYAESGFDAAALAAGREYPLADEAFVTAWAEYEREARAGGAVETLRRHLVQLRFPIAAGISESAEYQDATKRGMLPPGTAPAEFTDAEGIQIVLHATPAGRLPIVIARHRADFELLVRALTRRNEPTPIPRSMGACIIGGYNDWSRIALYRREWERRARDAAGDWPAEFRALSARKDEYQDRFVVLSRGPYSGTPAGVVGLGESEWLSMSLTIRLEHECAHYFTKRVFGSMRNSLLDELIADYTGIVAARGRFEPTWLRHFMGVERDDCWRPDGRLTNYRGTPPLSDAAFLVLQQVVRSAADVLDRFDGMIRGAGVHARARSLAETARAITAIARVGLAGLVRDDADEALAAAYADDHACRLS